MLVNLLFRAWFAALGSAEEVCVGEFGVTGTISPDGFLSEFILE